ncbi:hypothetical protein V1514DRAFT_325211 [Lipomyces japonicus]|uniref:uncharacterized protein n=1 Tax=Lipomyces japonicus TaxID=56871 RepID=UPI0034CFA65E
MHPNLDDPNYIDCNDLIFALQDCHQKYNMFDRQFRCNNYYEDVKRCIHAARLQRRRLNNLQSKNRADNFSRLMEREPGLKAFMEGNQVSEDQLPESIKRKYNKVVNDN